MYKVDIELIKSALEAAAPYEEHDIHPRIESVTIILKMGAPVRIIEVREANWHNSDGN